MKVMQFNGGPEHKGLVLGLSPEDMDTVRQAAVDAAMKAAKGAVADLTGIDLDKRGCAPGFVGISPGDLSYAFAVIARTVTAGYGIFTAATLEALAAACGGEIE